MHIPSLVIDLAMMLLAAGIVSVIFRKIHLPVILGYIAVGFLISPYFPMFFNVEDVPAIDTLSEIGVIIILFHIGLEFDFHKLLSVGSTAIVTALVKMSGVLVVGYLFGDLIGLSQMNCIFLGTMLAISSTVVIQKCFEDLKVTGERYTSLVMGELIMEDLIGVFMMVILASLSVGQSGGESVVSKLLLMGCYLLVWLIVGIYFLPTLLNRVMHLLNREMLIALSLGICFTLALLAKELGFSVELGAFLAGSFFAGTNHAKEVEHASESIKDMFAVIFFVSVGMKVDPSVIAEHWTSIIPIAIISVIAKLIFATLGMILSGQRMETSLKSGFSLAPIGEFSYIIAALGISLEVMDEYLYPVIVAASVLTTLATPVLIRNSSKVAAFMRKHLPKKLLEKIDRYTSSEQDETDHTHDWLVMIRNFFSSLLLYGIIMLVTAIAGVRLLYPSLLQVMPEKFSGIATCLLVYIIIAIFARPMLRLRDTTFTKLWLDRKANRPPLVILALLNVLTIAYIAFIPIHHIFGARRMLLLGVALIAILTMSKTDVVATFYLQLETRFLRNLNEKTLTHVAQSQGPQEWLDEDIHIVSYYVPKDAEYIGQTLEQLAWGKYNNILVTKIRRGKHTYTLPHSGFKIQAGDKLYLVGQMNDILQIKGILFPDVDRQIRTLEQFMESDYPDTQHALACLAIEVNGSEPYCGQAIINSKILSKAHCMILGIQKDGYPVLMPSAYLKIQKGDVLWVMGSNNNVGRLASYSLGAEEEPEIIS